MRQIYINGKEYSVAINNSDKFSVYLNDENKSKIYIIDDNIDPSIDTITYQINGGEIQTSASKIITVDRNVSVLVHITKHDLREYSETVITNAFVKVINPIFDESPYTYVLSEECNQINYSIVNDSFQITGLNTDETSIVLPRLYHT